MVMVTKSPINAINRMRAEAKRLAAWVNSNGTPEQKQAIIELLKAANKAVQSFPAVNTTAQPPQ